MVATRITSVSIVLFPLCLTPFAVSWGTPSEGVEDDLRALMSKDWRARRAACDALGNVRGYERRVKVVRALAERLRDEDSLVRRAAATALGKMGRAAKPAIPNLIRVIDQDYVGVAASRALQQTGQPAVMPLTRVVLKAEEPEPLRIAALGVLADFGPDAKPGVKHLVRLLKTEPASQDMTLAACRTLGAIGSEADLATSVLLELCEHENSLIRLQAARTLGKIGHLSRGDIRSFIRALEKEQEALLSISRGAMDARRQKLPSSTETPRQQGQIRNDEHRCARVQMEMISALEKLQTQLPWKEARSTAMPALINVLERPHTLALAEHFHPVYRGCHCPHCHLYIAAARALRFYGPQASEALPALQSLLQYDRPRNEIRKTIEVIQAGRR
jgi:HEAT repeat protein